MPAPATASDPLSAPPIRTLADLFARHGSLAYGEVVDQTAHALQCAALAEAEDAPDALITAALLHDIGHMLHCDAAAALAADVDDRHEALGAKFIARDFGADVSGPVALHVQAKRWLCARDPGYLERLSPVSARTLRLQGGPMSSAEADAFASLPQAQGAVRVRRWDDVGKQPGLATPGLDHFLAIAARCLRTA